MDANRVYQQVSDGIPEKFEGRDFLLVDDISKYLEIDPRGVRGLISRGQLAAYKVGKEYRIPLQGLQVYLESASAHTDDDKT